MSVWKRYSSITNNSQFTCNFRTWKVENLRAQFVSIIVCLQARRARCYFVHAKIAHLYVPMQSLYVKVVFMNAHSLHFTVNKFFSSLFTYFYKILHNSFCKFVSNLYYILKHFVGTQILYWYINNKSKIYSLSTFYENEAANV